MEVEGFTKQQIFDTMVKLVNAQKLETNAALADQRREAQELHQATLDALNEIRADLGEIQLQMAGGISKPTPAPTAASTLPLTPRDGDARPDGPGDDKLARGKAHDTIGVYVPPPARGAQIIRPSSITMASEAHPHRRYDDFAPHHRDPDAHHHRSLPKIDFPKFDGTCPKLWQKRCGLFLSVRDPSFYVDHRRHDAL
jgi:hypothetical protein